MVTYRIENLNGQSDITDPVITVEKKLRGLDPVAMTIDVTVYFSVTDGNGQVTVLGKQLDDVPVTALTYDEAGVYAAVVTALEVYLIP